MVKTPRKPKTKTPESLPDSSHAESSQILFMHVDTRAAWYKDASPMTKFHIDLINAAIDVDAVHPIVDGMDINLYMRSIVFSQRGREVPEDDYDNLRAAIPIRPEVDADRTGVHMDYRQEALSRSLENGIGLSPFDVRASILGERRPPKRQKESNKPSNLPTFPSREAAEDPNYPPLAEQSEETRERWHELAEPFRQAAADQKAAAAANQPRIQAPDDAVEVAQRMLRMDTHPQAEDVPWKLLNPDMLTESAEKYGFYPHNLFEASVMQSRTTREGEPVPANVYLDMKARNARKARESEFGVEHILSREVGQVIAIHRDALYNVIYAQAIIDRLSGVSETAAFDDVISREELQEDGLLFGQLIKVAEFSRADQLVEEGPFDTPDRPRTFGMTSVKGILTWAKKMKQYETNRRDLFRGWLEEAKQHPMVRRRVGMEIAEINKMLRPREQKSA